MVCVICGKEYWDFDVVDWSTGFKFCGNCYHAVKMYRSHMHDKYDYSMISDWLRIIADVRDHVFYKTKFKHEIHEFYTDLSDERKTYEFFA